MQKIGGSLHLSSGDLVGHLNCRYLDLDLRVANGELKKPKIWDPVLEALVDRGALHEQGFIVHCSPGCHAHTPGGQACSPDRLAHQVSTRIAFG